jgi:hypothetical protein
MNQLLRRCGSLLLAAAVLIGPAAASASACPFCGEANATDQNRSDAYQLSILFMLAMPALIFSGFAYGFYRLNRSAAATQEASEGVEMNESRLTVES